MSAAVTRKVFAEAHPGPSGESPPPSLTMRIKVLSVLVSALVKKRGKCHCWNNGAFSLACAATYNEHMSSCARRSYSHKSIYTVNTPAPARHTDTNFTRTALSRYAKTLSWRGWIFVRSTNISSDDLSMPAVSRTFSTSSLTAASASRRAVTRERTVAGKGVRSWVSIKSCNCAEVPATRAIKRFCSLVASSCWCCAGLGFSRPNPPSSPIPEESTAALRVSDKDATEGFRGVAGLTAAVSADEPTVDKEREGEDVKDATEGLRGVAGLTAAVSADEPTVDKEREGEDVSMEREVAGFSLLSILDLVVEVRREMGRDRELEGDCSFVSILDLVGADEDGS
jgi:hypothetical protein